MITHVVLSGLETVLNKVIGCDPEAGRKLERLQGKSIKINITDWNLVFYLLPYEGGVQLLRDYHHRPDTTISGTLMGLMKVGMAGGTTTALFEESITVSGDTRTGELLREVLRNIEIDWEEQLSKVVGDSLAHPIASGVGKVIHCGKESLKSFGENVAEYLQYESQQLPSKQAVEGFIEEVAVLRDDVDRLEARIQRLNLWNKRP